MKELKKGHHLFEALQNVCDFIALESDMDEIVKAVEKDNQENLPVSDVSMSDVIFECGTCGADTSELGFCPKCDTQAHSY
jgi:hypothetical protein